MSTRTQKQTLPGTMLKSSVTPMTSLVQRKCARGGSSGLVIECDDCSNNRLSLQRSTREYEGPHRHDSVPAIVHEVLRSPGQPLDSETRAFFEPRFGHNFSQVRVHADSEASDSASAVNSLAYTVGKDVVFAAGHYQPASDWGRRLLAHELAHTIQQASHHQIATQQLSVGRADDILERQAEALADQVVSMSPEGANFSPAPATHPVQPMLQRQPCKKSDDQIATGPLTEQLPNIPCAATGETLATVRAAASTPDILGVTTTSRSTPGITYQELRASKCKATVNSNYTMSFSQIMYTKEGTYDDGTETRRRGECCAGKTITRRIRIVPAMAEKLKAGEIEHCQDHKLAFAKSEGKFNQAIKDLEGEYCPDTTPPAAPQCSGEFARRFRDRTGFDFPQGANAFSDCLHQKTKLRDDAPNRWHSIVPNDFFCAPDCSAITYIPRPGDMTNIGNHPSSTIVRDCP